MPTKRKAKAEVVPRRPGAPTKIVDLVKLADLCRLRATAEDCAGFFECSVDTIERRIKEATELTYAEFRNRALVHTKMDLIRQALKLAQEGDTDMIKFCLKNVSDWSEKGESSSVQVNVQNNVDVKVQKIDLEERKALLREE